MYLTGEYRLPLPRAAVWDGLNDPEVLKRCIPGCEELVKNGDTEFAAKVALKIGPMSAKFSGKVTLSDIDPPKGYKIAGEGQGGVAGFGKGSAVVTLDEDGPDATILRYTADSQVGGKMAQLGSRLIDATARKLADDFFGKFAAAMGERAGPQAPSAAEAASPAPAPDASSQGLSPKIWIPALIAAVAAVVWLAAR
jgi:uncharacterized protein